MNNKYFPEIKGSFGFGMMRLPMNDGEHPDVNYEITSTMVDKFIESGFNYFDTAHGYLEGRSEIAVGKCLSARHDRDEYLLANKLTGDFFKTQEDIRPLFMSQLKTCGVDYFDFYLIHAVDKSNYKHFTKCKAYEEALKLKEEGYIRHLGMSYHDSADFLETVLTAHPEVEFVQLQLNYIDFDDAVVQSRKCLEVCNKYGKPVSVMEPVRGGSLANLPEKGKALVKELGDMSAASYALRFAAGCDGVYVTLSGMSNLEQMEDNTSTMKDVKPLTDAEKDALAEIAEIFKTPDFIPCTACHYCTAGCPSLINIPGIFAAMNQKSMFGGWNANFYYNKAIVDAKPSDCIKCGLCEKSCPQHLKIRDLLVKATEIFEKKKED